MGKEKIFEDLEKIANFIPAPIYWLDTEGVVLGANDLSFKTFGGENARYEVIGKEHHNFYPKDVADILAENNDKVVQLGQTVEFEEKIVNINTKAIQYLTSIRSPLFNDDGAIIGVIGTSIDISDRKEKERLTIELHKAELESHQKFRTLVDQLVHDLGSPLMMLAVLGNDVHNIPERQRTLLRNASSRIRDICGTLLSEYKPKEILSANDESLTELLVSATLEEIVMDKKYEYQHLPVSFNCTYAEDSQFSFIQADGLSFKRMLSNLLNNAVESLDSKAGEVNLKILAENDIVKIVISDTGCGMPQVIVDKIIGRQSFTAGKKHGLGIGFAQVYEALQQNNGQLSIQSELNIGTTITLIFPKTPTPGWILDNVIINPQDTIIILDDDRSIHDAWDFKFEDILIQHPDITIKHFEQASDFLNFVNNLTEEEKEHILLLSDYELLKQNTNGLAVIKAANIKRAVLVTSHYANPNIRTKAAEINIKILPKQLADKVLVCVNDANN